MWTVTTQGTKTIERSFHKNQASFPETPHPREAKTRASLWPVPPSPSGYGTFIGSLVPLCISCQGVHNVACEFTLRHCKPDISFSIPATTEDLNSSREAEVLQQTVIGMSHHFLLFPSYQVLFQVLFKKYTIRGGKNQYKLNEPQPWIGSAIKFRVFYRTPSSLSPQDTNPCMNSLVKIITPERVVFGAKQRHIAKVLSKPETRPCEKWFTSMPSHTSLWTYHPFLEALGTELANGRQLGAPVARRHRWGYTVQLSHWTDGNTKERWGKVLLDKTQYIILSYD